MLQYVFNYLAQREGEFVKSDDRYIQHEKIVISLKFCLADMPNQYTLFCLDYDALCAANDDLLNTCDANQQPLPTLLARALELESRLKAPRPPLSDPTNAAHDQDRYSVLLQSLAAEVLGLQAGYANISSCAQCSQASTRDDLGSLLNDFGPLTSI